eukprot:3282264-Pyramimonas_sp.AAC.1
MSSLPSDERPSAAPMRAGGMRSRAKGTAQRTGTPKFRGGREGQKRATKAKWILCRVLKCDAASALSVSDMSVAC